jgi:hypothetical protein
MTLDNLLRTGQLKRHVADRVEIGDLLAAAQRNLADARVENISTENRFDAAYKCIMQSALTALMANGFRPDTKVPGHHQTVIHWEKNEELRFAAESGEWRATGEGNRWERL